MRLSFLPAMCVGMSSLILLAATAGTGEARPPDDDRERFLDDCVEFYSEEQPGDDAVSGIVKLDNPFDEPIAAESEAEWMLQALFSVRLELDGEAGTVFLLYEGMWQDHSDFQRLVDRVAAAPAPLRLRVEGELSTLIADKATAKMLLRDEGKRQLLVMKVEEWFEVEEAFATEAADLPPPHIRTFARQKTFIVQQRSNTALPGSSGRVRLKTGDVTRGQVRVEVTADHDTLLIETVSLQPGEDVEFSIAGQTCRLKLVQFSNLIWGQDYAQFKLTVGLPPERHPTTAPGDG